MLLASALIVILSVVAFAVAFVHTDYTTGQAPDWTGWVAYASIAAFCLGVFGVLWELGVALKDMVG